jgi:hypothetical protein
MERVMSKCCAAMFGANTFLECSPENSYQKIMTHAKMSKTIKTPTLASKLLELETVIAHSQVKWLSSEKTNISKNSSVLILRVLV